MVGWSEKHNRTIERMTGNLKQQKDIKNNRQNDRKIKWLKNDQNKTTETIKVFVRMRDRKKDRTSRRPPCGQTRVEQTDCFLWTVWAWIRADCSNSSSCWERLASSDSKASMCKNKTRNLCFSLSLCLLLPPCSAALGRNVFWKQALICMSKLEMTQTRPRAGLDSRAPSGYSRWRRCQEALECRRHEREMEKEAVLPSDRIMSTSTHHTQTP